MNPFGFVCVCFSVRVLNFVEQMNKVNDEKKGTHKTAHNANTQIAHKIRSNCKHMPTKSTIKSARLAIAYKPASLTIRRNVATSAQLCLSPFKWIQQQQQQQEQRRQQRQKSPVCAMCSPALCVASFRPTSLHGQPIGRSCAGFRAPFRSKVSGRAKKQRFCSVDRVEWRN